MGEYEIRQSIKDRLFKAGTAILRRASKEEGLSLCSEESLLRPGLIERLVREGRSPVQIGTISVAGREKEPYYQVPPPGFDPDNIETYFKSPAGWIFTSKDGKAEIGSTHTLTENEAVLVDERVRREMTRLSRLPHNLV